MGMKARKKADGSLSRWLHKQVLFAQRACIPSCRRIFEQVRELLVAQSFEVGYHIFQLPHNFSPHNFSLVLLKDKP
jgi:hypothetical protein